MNNEIDSKLAKKEDTGMDNKDLGIICATLITLGSLLVSYLVGKLEVDTILKWGLGSVTLIAVGKSMMGFGTKK